MPFQSTTPASSWQPPSGWPAVTPTADLIAQLTTIIFHVARTAPSQSEAVHWATSRFNCLSHVTDSPERWSIDTEGNRS
jgi:hypothetical protein